LSSTKLVTILIVAAILAVGYQFRDFLSIDKAWLDKMVAQVNIFTSNDSTPAIGLQGPRTIKRIDETQSSHNQRASGASKGSGSEQNFNGNVPLKSFDLDNIKRVTKITTPVKKQEKQQLAKRTENFTPTKKAPHKPVKSTSKSSEKTPEKSTKVAKLKRNSVIKPIFVEPFSEIKKGYNDSNPFWSPAGDVLGFERSKLGKKEIILAHAKGKTLQVVYLKEEEKDDFDFLLPGVTNTESYNASISWGPNGKTYVFMSNAGKGNYDLYLGKLGTNKIERLTKNAEKDGHPHWSPKGDKLVFVSGRSMNAQLYMLDFKTREIVQLTDSDDAYFYPQWSANGKNIAASYGDSYQHNIFVLNDATRPKKSIHFLTAWEYDDLRPIWSPDGKKIAFYSNYNRQNDPDVWSIIVVDMIKRKGKLPRVNHRNIKHHVVASNVVVDVEHGLTWLPNSQGLLFVKKEDEDYNGIYYADLSAKSTHKLLTNTKINHDISCCSADGVFAFRAQINQWDQIFIAKLALLGNNKQGK